MFSLRCGVGLVNVIVIMIVASITLSITLTNTLDAINTNGLAHVLSILGTAEAAVGTTFDGLFSQLDAVSDTLSEKDWPFPSSGTPSSTYADWRDRLLQLYLTGPSHFVVVYFSDESLLFVQDDSALSNVVAFDGIVATPFPQSANVSSFTKGMTVSTTLTEASWYFNRTDGTMMATYPGPATPNANFNLAAFTGPTWLYDQVAGPQAQAKSAKTLMGNFIVRRRNSAVVSIMAMSNFRRPVDQGSTYPFGIAFAGITLDQLSNYLFAVLDSSDSLAYCIDSAGVIVAASSAAVTPFYSGPTAYPSGSTLPQNCETSSTLDQTLVHNDTFVACRLALSQSGHPAVSEVGVGWVVASTTARAKQVTVSGSNYFAAALKLQLRYDGVELFLLLVIPESDVIGNVVQGRNIAIGVTCAAFVVVAVLSFIVTSWLLKPLTRIAERMSMAARLEDDNGKETLSWMREVYDLQLAYYEMNEELNRVRSFVPQAVLQHDNAQIDDSSTQTPHRKDAPNKRKKASAGQIPLAEATEAARRMSNSGGSKSISDISRTRVVDLHCTLNTNVVTVMTINLSHFHREAFALPPKQVVAGLSDIVGVVTQEVTSRGGVLSLFHGDHFVVAFNGSKRCDRHARMAILAAVSIRDEINNQAHASRGPLRLRCPVRVGVATGTCLVGPVGNTTVKTFATIGPCVVQSNMLQRVVNQYGAGSSVLVTKRAAIEAGGKFELVYVDVVNLPTRTGVEPVPIAAVVSVASNTEGLHASENEFIQAVRHRNWRIEGNEEPASVSRSTTGLYVDTTDKGSVDKHSSKTAASSRDGPNTSRSNETITSPPFFVNPDDTTPLAEADGGSVLGLVPPPSRSPRGKADNKFGPEQQRSLAATIEAKWDIISRIEPLLDGHGYIGTDPETKVMVSNSLGAYFALCAMS